MACASEHEGVHVKRGLTRAPRGSTPHRSEQLEGSGTDRACMVAGCSATTAPAAALVLPLTCCSSDHDVLTTDCTTPAKGDTGTTRRPDGQTPHPGPNRLSVRGGAAHDMDQRHHPHTTTDRPIA